MQQQIQVKTGVITEALSAPAVEAYRIREVSTGILYGAWGSEAKVPVIKGLVVDFSSRKERGFEKGDEVVFIERDQEEVHGRTRVQRFAFKADWDRMVLEATSCRNCKETAGILCGGCKAAYCSECSVRWGQEGELFPDMDSVLRILGLEGPEGAVCLRCILGAIEDRYQRVTFETVWWAINKKPSQQGLLWPTINPAQR